MRAVIQRVTEARVHVGTRIVGEIGVGLLVLLGIGRNDTADDVTRIVKRIVDLRIFAGEGASGSTSPMNRSIGEVGGRVLLVSQFTLYADTSKGRRPSFHLAAPPDIARLRYEEVVQAFQDGPIPVQTGEFGALMRVDLVNDGPVTILIDTQSTHTPGEHA